MGINFFVVIFVCVLLNLVGECHYDIVLIGCIPRCV